MQLTYGATTISLPAPLRPVGRDDAPQQIHGRDSAGSLYLYRTGNARQVMHSLRLRLSSIEFTALEAFVRTTIKGQRRHVTWTDEQAGTHDCVLADPSLIGKPLTGGRYEVELRLIERV